MKDESYWKKFWVSGRVEDYLTYQGKDSYDNFPQSKTRDEVVKAEVASESLGEITKADYLTGECHYAGFDFSDRNGVKPDTCG